MSVGATIYANEGQLLIASWVDVTPGFATTWNIKVDGVEIPLKHFICGTSNPQSQYVCIRVPAFVSLEVSSNIQYAPELIVYDPID
jgi:hypothetical protein